MNSTLYKKYNFDNGNKIAIIDAPGSGYDQLIKAISSAKETIYFAGYCFRPGSLFTDFEKSLIAAAKRGVVTYILADHHGSSSTSESSIERLSKAGAIWVSYRPLSFAYAPTYDFRLHKKLLIIDNKFAFTGGLGIDDSWIQASAKYPKPWVDTHFKIEGRIVDDMQKSFISSWNAFCPKEYELSFNPEGREQTSGVQIAAIESPPNLNTTRAGKLYIDMVDAAKDSIYATTAYFGPPRKFRLALQRAAKRGVQVNLMVNGEYNTHHYAAEAGRRWYKQLLVAGVRIYEYQPTKIHSKLMTIDKQYTSIGSANLNFRSFYTDAEFNLLVNDQQFSSKILEEFERNLISSKRVTLDDVRSVGVIRRLYRFGVSLARVLY